jgi:hypothetical protein
VRARSGSPEQLRTVEAIERQHAYRNATASAADRKSESPQAVNNSSISVMAVTEQSNALLPSSIENGGLNISFAADTNDEMTGRGGIAAA